MTDKEIKDALFTITRVLVKEVREQATIIAKLTKENDTLSDTNRDLQKHYAQTNRDLMQSESKCKEFEEENGKMYNTIKQLTYQLDKYKEQERMQLEGDSNPNGNAKPPCKEEEQSRDAGQGSQPQKETDRHDLEECYSMAGQLGLLFSERADISRDPTIYTYTLHDEKGKEVYKTSRPNSRAAAARIYNYLSLALEEKARNADM